MSDNYRWSLGTLVGFPLLVLLVVLLVVGGILLLRLRKRLVDPEIDAPIVLTLAVGCFVGAFAAVIGTAWGMWPYTAEYHQWQATSGTVAAIDSRFVGADRSTTQRFVVTFTDGRQRACDDTRCAQVHEGDRLTLSCKRAWQYASTSGYDCNYVGRKAAS